MQIDRSIKVGDIIATNASNVLFSNKRVFGEVVKIDFTDIHTGFNVSFKPNKKIFNEANVLMAYPYNAPGRPFDDAYLVKATPEECEAHRTGVMPAEKDLWCVEITEDNIDLLNNYMIPLLEKHGKSEKWKISKESINGFFKCPDLWDFSHSVSVIPNGAELITTEEFLEKTGTKKKKEFMYKKGVWYKHGSCRSFNSFRKCNEDSDDEIPYSERILEDKYEVYEGIAQWNGIEADMNEVSKYLPDGHPDKIVETVNQELQIGKWYKAQGHYYLKFEKIEDCGIYKRLHGETINNGDYSAKDYWSNRLFEDDIKRDGPLKDLSEIQDYLPNDHPDKVKEKTLKASEVVHDFHKGQMFKILVDKPHSSGLKKGDIVTCRSVFNGSITVRKDENSITWELMMSTIGKNYEPYFGDISEQIENSKNEEYSSIEESNYSFGFIDQSDYKLGYDPFGEPKIVFPKNDTFDPIVKAPIVI